MKYDIGTGLVTGGLVPSAVGADWHRQAEDGVCWEAANRSRLATWKEKVDSNGGG